MLKTASASSSSTSTTTGSTKVTMSLSSSPQSSSSSSHHHSAIAGYAAGLTGTIVGYPLDTLKLWMQTNRVGENKHLAGSASQQQQQSRTVTSSSSKSSSSGSSGNSLLRAGGTIRSFPGSVAMSSTTSSAAAASRRRRMKSTIATTATTASTVPTTQSSTTRTFAQNALRMKSNLQALYSGVSAPLMTVGLVQSINFAVYDSTRRYLFSSGNNNSSSSASNSNSNSTIANYRSSDPIQNVAIAGFVSGTATAVVTAPLILIKTHQQITGSSFQQAFQSLPMKGCRAGFLPHLVCETFGRSVYYATYETMKRTFSRMNNAWPSTSTNTTTTGQSSHDDVVSLGQRMVCAASSGIICWSLIFPLDSLRSRVYSEFVVGNNNKTTASGAGSKSTSSRIRSSSSSSLLVSMIRKMHNEQSFYRGFRVTVLRAGPVAAVVLPVYDLVLDTLSSSSSSSSR